MLSGNYRLRSMNSFQAVRRQGMHWRASLFTTSILKNSFEHNRYGFVVSKRIAGAVQRNRVKRQLRGAVYRLDPYLRTGYDVVLVAQPAIVLVSFDEILDQADASFQKLDLFLIASQEA